MSNPEKVAAAAAGAVGGKAARACDGCMKRRARWYCAADDAFLCQSCDNSVHSANPLARRHERLRLRPSMPPPHSEIGQAALKRQDLAPPAWFTRKARTPRSHTNNSNNTLKSIATGSANTVAKRLVPELTTESSDEQKVDGEEEQLLYRVPIFDPALAEFCSPPPPLEDSCKLADVVVVTEEDGGAKVTVDHQSSSSCLQYFENQSPAIFGPSDAELTEFAADMEALLGRGLDDGNQDDSFYLETLGLIDSIDDDTGKVKVESQGGAGDEGLNCNFELEPEASGEMLDIDFDCSSPMAMDDIEDDKTGLQMGSTATESSTACFERGLRLNLDYEAIISSWCSSPWTNGERPQFKLDDCWPHDYSGMWMAGGNGIGGTVGGGGHVDESVAARLGILDSGREARVTRYREKRQTRLFSKKIRYEVRKLNAEKRPRMKGRFVKRANTGAAAVCLG